VLQGNSSVPFKTVKIGLTISVNIHSCDEWETVDFPFCWANSLTSVLTTTHTHTHVCTFHIASTIYNAHILFSCILLSTLCLTRCPPGHIHYLPLDNLSTWCHHRQVKDWVQKWCKSHLVMCHLHILGLSYWSWAHSKWGSNRLLHLQSNLHQHVLTTKDCKYA